MRKLAVAALFLLPLACDKEVGSSDDARKAYLGIDPSIDKAITLGFAGFNSANSANIDPQTVSGSVSGTLTVTGQVDQGNSANKGMRLLEAMANYADNMQLAYNTRAGALPMLNMSLKGIPTGTLDGTLVGTFTMTGDLTGDLTLNLAFNALLQPNPNDMTRVERKPGTTRITGTATSSSGTYSVDLTR